MKDVGAGLASARAEVSIASKKILQNSYKTKISRIHNTRMDKIQIKLKSSFAVGVTEEFLADFQDGHEVIIELEEGSTVGNLLLKLSSIGSPDEWDDMLLHVFVNDVIRGMDYILQDGDEVNLHLPISGG